MNKQLRKKLVEAHQLISEVIETERESLDNQEENFGSTQRWQDSDEITTDAESLLDELNDILERWGCDV